MSRNVAFSTHVRSTHVTFCKILENLWVLRLLGNSLHPTHGIFQDGDDFVPRNGFVEKPYLGTPQGSSLSRIYSEYTGEKKTAESTVLMNHEILVQH